MILGMKDSVEDSEDQIFNCNIY